MKNLINWIGLCLLFVTALAGANEISFQDIWIRPQTQGRDTVMVGMVVKSEKPARITSVISTAYSSVLIYGPGKDGKKTQEYEYITLPEQRKVVLGAEGTHLLLSGSKRQGAVDRIPLIISVQFDDNTLKSYSVVALAEGSKSAAESQDSNGNGKTAAALAAPSAPALPVESAAGALISEAADSNGAAKAAVQKRQVAEKKPAKSKPEPKPEPKTEPKPEPKQTGSHAVVHAAAPVPAPAPVVEAVAPPQAPAAVAAPVAPVVAAEPKKEVDTRATEKAAQQDAETRAECRALALELRECEKTNDMMQEWCAKNAKANSSCKLSMEQIRKLR